MMNTTYSVEVSEENAMLLKSILREEGISYKVRPYEIVEDERGKYRRGLGTIHIENDADFLAPYRRVVQSELSHSVRRLSQEKEYKDEYNWDNIRINAREKRDKLVEEIMNKDETFDTLRSAVRESVESKLKTLNKEPKRKKKK